MFRIIIFVGVWMAAISVCSLIDDKITAMCAACVIISIYKDFEYRVMRERE